MTDVFTVLQEPFFVEGINEFTLFSMIRTYSKNMINLNCKENIDLASDLMKYKLKDPNQFFEDFINKIQQNSKSNITDSSPEINLHNFVSEGVQAV